METRYGKCPVYDKLKEDSAFMRLVKAGKIDIVFWKWREYHNDISHGRGYPWHWRPCEESKPCDLLFKNIVITPYGDMLACCGIGSSRNPHMRLGNVWKESVKTIYERTYEDILKDGSQDYDVLGFIYEYLISNFAANAGKKAGEFYTPHEVALMMSEIVAHHLRNADEIKIYDPTSGSVSLLLNIGRSVGKFIEDKNKIVYYAQELKEATYNLTRMNLVMRGILPDNIVVRNGDTLEEDWPWFDDSDPTSTYNPLYCDAV